MINKQVGSGRSRCYDESDLSVGETPTGSLLTRCSPKQSLRVQIRDCLEVDASFPFPVTLLTKAGSGKPRKLKLQIRKR